MSEAEATTSQRGTAWRRYRHRDRPEIEYDVEIFASNGSLVVHTAPTKGEPCFRVRTIRNLSFREEAHRPAYTYMPTEGFLEVYERAEDVAREERFVR
ncbi:hypothetical protein GBA65_15155 [Rubrobacter marinus]|uniref:Uncharacterized protein n=1 Tax=Rubrobacter marinus TaxID=2653852 RepID=A0A6G8PZL7_9ACTN|nr:hypothetical protein [Rubrobacter marinus]QIN79642.1 hypothetical protein GBA65_15155 [Rubrobacter marinus]